MNVRIRIVVSDGTFGAPDVTVEKEVSTIPQLPSLSYPASPQVQGYGEAGHLLMKMLDEVKEEALDRLQSLHEQDAERVEAKMLEQEAERD